MKRIITILFAAMICLCAGAAAAPAYGDTDDGTIAHDMETGNRMFITLESNPVYRWNVNGSAAKNNVLHLDDSSGYNCQFRFDKVENDWYGLKHIKDDGIDRFVDVEDRSKASGSVLHVWEEDDDELGGSKNYHRHFAFYYVKTDSNGNRCYYIKNRNSGLWVGVENNSIKIGSKIVQTTKENRRLWIVTPAVVPLSGDEAKVLPDNNPAYCEFSRKGTTETINRVEDHTQNAQLWYYNIGTSSKWYLKWVDKYKAYEIEVVKSDESRCGTIWAPEKKGGGGDIFILTVKRKDRGKNDGTEQLWRFVQQSDGSYKLRNARSGRYMAESKQKYLKESDSGGSCELDVIRGADDDRTYAFADPWMENIPDGAYLSSVNMPGTHDTGTAAVVQDNIPSISLTSCQSFFFDEQLSIGARAFDIRCSATKSRPSPADVKIIHGSELWQCSNRDGSDLTLKDIFDESVKFLNRCPSEAIVMTVKPDDGMKEELAAAVGDFIKNNKKYVWTGDGIPTMGEARGKIVFVRRYPIDVNRYNPADDGLQTSWFGPDVTGWDNHDYSAYKYAIKIYPSSDKDNPNIPIYVQDAYNKYSSGKWDYITGTMKQTVGNDSSHKIPANAWIYNYTSAAVGFPLGLTRDINPKLMRDSSSDNAGYIDNRRLGMVMLNFINGPTSRLIYQTNQDSSKFYEPKVTFPDRIAITYGDPLSKAVLSGQSSGDKGSWVFEDGDYMPTPDDYKAKKTFKLTYKPADSRIRPVTKDVTITDFNKKPVYIILESYTIVYGQPIPELNYIYNQRELASGDTAADLGVTVRLDLPSPIPEKLPPGTYKITADISSDKYQASVSEGSLQVNKKKLGVKWDDTSNLVWTGDPVNVSAELTGVLSGEDCQPLIEGGNEIGPSWNSQDPQNPTAYTATVTGLKGADKDNYQLPSDGTSVNYYIRRAEATDYRFPDEAIMTYGQKLSEAQLVGASGNGRFVFVEMQNGRPVDMGDKMPDAGTKDYTMAFVPENTDLERAVSEQVPVTVSPRPITVRADAQNKTYGNETPELTWELDTGSQLAAADDKKALKLDLTAGGGDSKMCPAGTYTIEKGTCENTNYEVTVMENVLQVARREAELSWPQSHTLSYTGNPADITAEVTNRADPADDCEVNLAGIRTNAGSYTAVAVSLSNKNYALPRDASKLAWKYTIEKADPGVTFPTTAEITYGQTLSQAKLTVEKQPVAGTFAFTDAEKMPQVKDSGSKYEMTFTPADSANYQSVTQDVPVKVTPKPLTVVIDNKEKTYGQPTPQLTWHMDESQLVAGDQISDFKLALQVEGNGGSQDCDAGSYRIEATVQNTNDNYRLVYDGGILTVAPLLAEIKWSDTTNIEVGGKAPEAEITNLLTGDDCRLNIDSDGTDEPSWTADSQELKDLKIFKAEITGTKGADKDNYQLPEDLSIQYLVRRAGASDYSMPQKAVMTYGQSLSQARLILAAGAGDFTFVSNQAGLTDIGDTVPQAAGEQEYWLKYTPEDMTRKPVVEKVSVTIAKKNITAQAENAEKTYGEKTKLTYTLDESQLVNGDTKDDLNLILTAVGEENVSGDEERSPAGVYTIREKSVSPNYRVALSSASLWIRQRQTGIVWSDVSNLSYTGKPAGVTASAGDLLPGDEAKIRVIGGDQVEVGTYKAIAESISNDNYRLPTDKDSVEQRILTYTIQKAVPQVTFPKAAVLTYGQSLAAAELRGAAGEGDFDFDNPAETPSVKESGKTRRMVFNPADTTRYYAVSRDVEIQVQPLTVSLTWLGAKARDYDGKPSKVRAVAGNLLKGDSCKVTVKNGNQVKPGTYTAKAVKLSNHNYALPGNASKKYTIRGTGAGAAGYDGNKTAGTSDPSKTGFLVAANILLILSLAAIIAVFRRKGRTK